MIEKCTEDWTTTPHRIKPAYYHQRHISCQHPNQIKSKKSFSYQYDMSQAFAAAVGLDTSTNGSGSSLHPMDRILLPDLEALREAHRPNVRLCDSSRSCGSVQGNLDAGMTMPRSKSWSGSSMVPDAPSSTWLKQSNQSTNASSFSSENSWKSALAELHALEAVMTCCPTAKCIAVPIRRPELSGSPYSGALEDSSDSQFQLFSRSTWYSYPGFALSAGRNSSHSLSQHGS